MRLCHPGDTRAPNRRGRFSDAVREAWSRAISSTCKTCAGNSGRRKRFSPNSRSTCIVPSMQFTNNEALFLRACVQIGVQRIRARTALSMMDRLKKNQTRGKHCIRSNSASYRSTYIVVQHIPNINYLHVHCNPAQCCPVPLPRLTMLLVLREFSWARLCTAPPNSTCLPLQLDH